MKNSFFLNDNSLEMLRKEAFNCSSELKEIKKKSDIKKYVRRKDIEQYREENYMKQHQETEKKSKFEETNNNNNVIRNQLERSSSQPKMSIPFDEVIIKLRSRKQPILLFGESFDSRERRLSSLLEIDKERNKEGTGQLNELKKLLQEDVESDLLRENEKAARKGLSRDSNVSISSSSVNNVDLSLKVRSDFGTIEEYINWFVERTLAEWEIDLNNRPDSIKISKEGKNNSAMHKQTRQNLKPFIDSLKFMTADKSVIDKISKIVALLYQREYVEANNMYLDLAIGNAAWPIGVTTVSIHERTGREKIASESVAHILNDETTRKYVQSIKRLMTFYQKKYPNPEASKNLS